LDHTFITPRTLAASSKELTLAELVHKRASICRSRARNFEVGSSDGEQPTIETKDYTAKRFRIRA
jgi:hypothetical protein